MGCFALGWHEKQKAMSYGILPAPRENQGGEEGTIEMEQGFPSKKRASGGEEGWADDA
jgi:hypothetical protein